MRKLGFLVLLAACSPFNPDLGQGVPYLCNDTEPRCPEGYTCMELGPDAIDKKCVIEGGTAPDADTSGGFPCANDGNFEPNDSYETAFQTDVGTSMERRFGPLSICPEGDKDHFAVQLGTTGLAIEGIATVEGGEQVSVALLGTSGNMIATSTMVDGKTMRTCAPNLPSGSYYVVTYAGATTQQNYRVTLRIVQNCVQQ